jgi:hypothetical protein
VDNVYTIYVHRQTGPSRVPPAPTLAPWKVRLAYAARKAELSLRAETAKRSAPPLAGYADIIENALFSEPYTSQASMERGCVHVWG